LGARRLDGAMGERMQLNHATNFESSNPIPATVHCKVLLVDDQIPQQTRCTASRLRGFTVDCAATGAQALAKTTDETRCHRPRPATARSAGVGRARPASGPRECHAGGILTAFGDFQSACVAGRFGADRFMTKPIFSELGTAVRELLNLSPSAAAPRTLESDRCGRASRRLRSRPCSNN
jgi:CheY-like chemotaxis protein